MKHWLYDLLATACTYLPHRWRKWLHRKASTLTSLLDPPGCNERSCCWPEGPFTISGIEFCQPPQHDSTDTLANETVEQWAERTCLRAHETNAKVITVDRNHGGGLAASLLRTTWQSLITNGKLPATAEMPRIEETAARRTGAEA